MMLKCRPRHPVTGRRFRITAGSKRELEAYRHRLGSIRTELRLGLRSVDDVNRELARLQHGAVTLERAARSYAARPVADNTRRAIASLLRTHWRTLGQLELVAIDVGACIQWIDSLRAQKLEPTTIGTAWRNLSAVVRYAIERGWVAACPWGSWRPAIGGKSARLPREAARSVDELAELLRAARRLDEVHHTGLEAKIALAGLLGLRQGELAGLKWSDVVYAEPSVLVARQWDGRKVKGKRPKRLATIGELVDVLRRHAQATLADHGIAVTAHRPIFPRPGTDGCGHYVKGQVLTSRDLRSAVRAAGLPNVDSWSPHSLRDTFVTLEALATGGDLVRVQDRSRHASVASLARYLRAGNRHPTPPAIAFLPRADVDGAGPPVPELPPPAKK